MTPQNIITDARYILNDTDATAYRNSDNELLGWVNDLLDIMAGVRPEFFSEIADHTCSTGAEQTLATTRAVKILDVRRVVGGTAILPADKAALDAFSPGWYSEAASAAVNWMPGISPLKFYLYPPAANTQHVEVLFVRAPAVLVIGDTLPIPDNYQMAFVNGVVGYAEAKDDEHVDSNRSAQAKADFVALIGA